VKKLAPVTTKRSKVVRARKVRERKRAEEDAREEEELVEKALPAEPKPGLVKWTVGVLMLLVALFLLLMLFVYPNADGPGAGSFVEIDVTPQMSASDLADKLASQGAVGNRTLFGLYLRLHGTSNLVVGHHILSDSLSPSELLARLERKGASKVRVTIPEGWTRFDIAHRLETSRVCSLRSFLDATTDLALMQELAVDGPSLEGYLFPATYDFDGDADAKDVARIMAKEFERRYSSLEDKNPGGIKDLADSLGWGRKQIVILASMIEKEAVVDDERAIIASVFVNRLRDPAFSPKLLQCDPTAGYGCLVTQSAACDKYVVGKITHDILADELNPYNTYKRVGLPPGPISNPGEKSLAAAMSPALTRYFYFVAKGGGRHNFSESYAQHTSAIKGDAGP
jgi:UPF0755 protein